VRVFGFFGNGPGRRGPKTLNPEQQMNKLGPCNKKRWTRSSQNKTRRYDAMSEDEREKYYMKPRPV